MEAARALRPSPVRVLPDRVVIDGLIVDDRQAVELIGAREQRGDDPAAVVVDAIEIGARVLAREQTAVEADWVRSEFEKVSREVETAFTERARGVAEVFSTKVDEVFGADSGRLEQALARHFSDDSAGAVQHRVKAMVAELLVQSRQDLIRQFSVADGTNPLADFKSASVAAIRQAADRQDQNLRVMLEKMAALERELQGLRDARERDAQLAEEHDRGTAKGREFEVVVAEAIDQIALAQGDDCDAVGDLRGATGKTGDVVVGIDACRGPARGRIVFEAKTGKLSKPGALKELDQALEQRDAEFAVLVVPSDDKLPARMQPLREYNGDKLVVSFDPEDGSRVALEVAYSLARARVLMTRGGSEGVDATAVRDGLDRALAALEEVRRIKQQLTGAATGIEQARAILETMAARVREQLQELDVLLARDAEAGRQLALD